MQLGLKVQWFFSVQVQGRVKTLIEEHFSADLESAMRDPILFGDYRAALNEAEPRVYEDIQDYDAYKALFQVMQIQKRNDRKGNTTSLPLTWYM